MKIVSMLYYEGKIIIACEDGKVYEISRINGEYSYKLVLEIK